MVPPILPELFSNYLEIHASLLGVLLGLFVGFFYRRLPNVSYALLFLGVLCAFGNAPDIGYANEINVKPWYFLSMLYVTTVGHLLAVKYATRLRRWLSLSRTSAGAVRNPTDD